MNVEAAGAPGPPVSVGGVRRDGGRYAWYVCLVLMLVLAISYMDRSVLALLVAPIETAFSVRDTTNSPSRWRASPTGEIGATSSSME